MLQTLREAMSTDDKGLKVIVADGECQLARQRRIRPQIAAQLKRGERMVRTRFGVDDEVCTGDHSCIRLSGCPSLVVKPSADPLRTDPVAHVNNGCVGCGLCGEGPPMPPCFAHRSTRRTSSRTPPGGIAWYGSSARP